ncbi:uncharacterized protein LOC135487178 isoform X2 [Lineus longissimus]|uniref:uncharacterized protein LOC135487178 isoform X2 n=1 Tax=Lineus longissimus TaxID=88925 RepID=UPI002B4E6085
MSTWSPRRNASKVGLGLPRTILPILLPYLSASGLHQLQALFDKEGISTEETWRKQLESRWGTGKTAYKVTDVFGSVYCSLHQYYMSKHVMDLLSFFIHRNPIDPKHIFTTRLDKIPILRIRRSADDVDESHLLVRSSMEDLYHYAKHAYTFHLYSQAQVTFLTENWKIVENLAQGVIKLIIHNAVDKGYEKWRGIVNFFIECGSVDHVVVIFPRLTILNLRNLIFCCAGVHSVPDNSATQQQSPNMNTECTLSSSSDCWQEPGANFSAILNHSANLKHSGLTMMSNSAESTTSDETFLTNSATCTSFQCNGVDAGHTCRISLVPDDSELKELQHDPSANASSYSVNLSLDDLSESAVDQCRTTTVDAIGIKRKLNSDLASDESFSEAKVSRLNSSDDITSPDEMTQDLFDEALMLPVVSPEKPSLSSKQAEKFGIESIAGVEHKNLESRATTSDICDLSNYANFSSSGSLDCDQLTWHGRGVKKFVLSHSFFYDDDSEVDAVAMILCEVLQHWKDLEQFAMMHVYTETDKLEKCYVQLLEVLKRLVLNGQLTNLVLRDTKMPCDQYQLPLQFKRANVETEPLKRLDISNVRYSQGDLDKLVWGRRIPES